ncbi:pyroglutamyl-peptidase I [Bifidobacterium choloepi]|uniref:Pyroglutamyl-peptidase I n=1 Tax=Bifidobacterium choloepi TaxID=2614131 RepID=A0A6I5NB52_9BIFI|nr:pyroglutamyl-peptidase I [Bifidobacterium choloepi]NEG69700.1 pyroglutamyl-peptidase I [Bifidobacterium choloepi]
MTKLTVVMSGFDPYDGVEVNPSLIVPRTLAAQGVAGNPDDYDDPLHDVDVTIRSVILPVSFGSAWPQLEAVLEREHPDIVIATGLKRAARGILLERCAENLKDAEKPDADNVIPERGPIDESGPAAYWTGLPLRAILQAFARDNIPATLSSDAGTYVCNALFYHLENWASRQDKALAGFVNLPLVNEQPHPQHGLPLDQQVTAARDVVRQSARYFLGAVKSPSLLP